MFVTYVLKINISYVLEKFEVYRKWNRYFREFFHSVLMFMSTSNCQGVGYGWWRRSAAFYTFFSFYQYWGSIMHIWTLITDELQLPAAGVQTPATLRTPWAYIVTGEGCWLIRLNLQPDGGEELGAGLRFTTGFHRNGHGKKAPKNLRGGERISM